MERKAASNVARGTVVMEPPRSWIAAASLKAPGSPWKATRMVLGSNVLMGRRYLAIRCAKRKAKICSRRKTFPATHRVQRYNALLGCESGPNSLLLSPEAGL